MKRTKQQISYNMSQIKSKGSRIEKTLHSALKKEKIKFKEDFPLYGKPDFVILRPKKTVIFCDSAFWHGFKNMKTSRHNFKRNKSFWKKKISGNILRDKKVNSYLKKEGRIVIRLWDFQIQRDIDKCIDKIRCRLWRK